MVPVPKPMRRKLQASRESGDDAAMGRKYEKLIAIRLTGAELERWSAAAAADQRPLSNWIRLVVTAHLDGISKTKRGK